MRFENVSVFNFENALRGMRNPKKSWNRIDTKEYNENETELNEGYSLGSNTPMKIYIGPQDLRLAQSLIRAGSEHRKFMRQIMVSVDITAPIYWWKEFDTYKVGTTSNSTSTMHTLATTPITIECFEIDDYVANLPIYDTKLESIIEILMEDLEWTRQKFIETQDIRYWKELIRWLPEGWLQTRTITMNYENIYNMIRQRYYHKLTEWSDSTMDFFRTLPYAKELLFLDKDKEEEC